MKSKAGRQFICAVILACFISVEPNAFGATLQLDVTGNITNHNRGKNVYHLSEEDLLAMPQHEIVTSTAWTPKSTFRGIALTDLLARVGAKGTELRMTAYDGYAAYGIPITDARQYGVILAYSRDGRRLQLSDFGPLFVVYPRDQFPVELNNSLTEGKFVWQLKSIEVK
jgi:hypothetical protein